MEAKISGPARYLAMLAKPLIVIPGGSSACVRLFDSAGRNIGNWVFPTGWRIDVASASLEYSALLKRQLLVMRMVRFINGRNIAKEYYDFHGDQLRLVRLENDEGELAQSEYVSKTYEIGPVLEAISAQEWLGLLRSADPGAVLAALTFLGGRHLDGPDRLFGPGGHEGQYAPLFLRLLESAEIRGAIEELHGSKNLWIREVALTASRGPRARLWIW